MSNPEPYPNRDHPRQRRQPTQRRRAPAACSTDPRPVEWPHRSRARPALHPAATSDIAVVRAAEPPTGLLPPAFQLEVRPAREAVWVIAAGELDLAATPSLRHTVGELAEVGFEQVMVDLRDLTFIDVAGIRLLLELTDRAADGNCQLSLICGDGPVWRMLALTCTLHPLPLTRDSDG